MPKRIQQDYFKRETAEVAHFITSLKDNAAPGGTFDSAAAADFMASAMNQNPGARIPASLQAVFDDCKDEGERERVARATLDGVHIYEEQHGMSVPADVAEQALHLAYATTSAARHKYGAALDSASSAHHDQASIQPNRAVVSILTTFAEAVPFAHYLPADIGPNEARLAIVSHHAGNTFGAYAQNDLLDGTRSGGAYVSASRVHTSTPAAADGAVAGRLTVGQNTSDTCDQAAAGVKLLRGRTVVYVNGVVAAQEPINSPGTGNSPINGSITIAGNTYVIGGTINTDTGVYALTTAPKLPDTIPVTVEGFIDFERDASITPSIITSVSTYPLYAAPWRVITRQSIDGRTQMANELNLDSYSESIIAIQNQFANERHYNVLAKARRVVSGYISFAAFKLPGIPDGCVANPRHSGVMAVVCALPSGRRTAFGAYANLCNQTLAANNQSSYHFGWASRSQQMNRAHIWQDFSATLGAVSQQMAVDTMNHGITHLYVGKDIASQFMALGRDMFEPSGIATRAGIFRIGRLFGQYEVYYTPKEVLETANSGNILCVGRATDVARNPIVLGDAVAPTVRPLQAGDDMREGAGFYARNFTAVNPHGPSSPGCATINVTSLR